MGNNIDFCSLLGLPKKIICPRCQREIYSGFDDYDIDCGSPEATDIHGMILSCYCGICEYEFKAEVKAELKMEKFE